MARDRRIGSEVDNFGGGNREQQGVVSMTVLEVVLRKAQVTKAER